MTTVLLISNLAALLIALTAYGTLLRERSELTTTRLERDTLARLAASQTVQRLNATRTCEVLARSLTHSVEGNQRDALAMLGEYTNTHTEDCA